jgi:adenosylcobinamide-phosphate synthase
MSGGGAVRVARLWAAGLAVGVVADRVLGDPKRWHPVAGLGRVAVRLERAVWRPDRAAGALYTAVLVAGPAVAAGLLDRAFARWPMARVALIGAATWTALGGRSLEQAGSVVAARLAAGDVAGARAALPSLVGRDPSDLPVPEICRATIESVAENTADAVIGPLLWGAVAGPAGVVGYRVANTLDAMIGHRNPRYERFGWAAARLDDIATWPAARLTALVAVTLASVSGGSRRQAWHVLRRDGGRHPSPNAGRCEAAFAGVLGIRLGGTNRYLGRVEHRPGLGDGPAPQPSDIGRAVRLTRATGLAGAALLVLGAHIATRWRARPLTRRSR